MGYLSSIQSQTDFNIVSFFFKSQTGLVIKEHTKIAKMTFTNKGYPWTDFLELAYLTPHLTCISPQNLNEFAPGPFPPASKIHLPITKFPPVHFPQHNSQLLGKEDIGEMEVYTEEMDWGKFFPKVGKWM